MTFTFQVTEGSTQQSLHVEVADSIAAAVVVAFEIKAPSQAWGDASITYKDVSTGGGAAVADLGLPLNIRDIDARARVSEDGAVTWLPYSELSYASRWNDTVPTGLNSRVLTYKEVRDGVLARCGSTLPSEADLARLAKFITAANRQSHQGYAWSEVIVTEEIDCDDGKVLWADVQGADHRHFWTADPRPATTTAIQIQEKTADADGIWLSAAAANRTTVWVSYVPRFPVFSATEIVAETSYAYGFTGYDSTSGHCFECVAVDGALGSAINDAAQWRARPVLWIVQDVVEELAEASVMARSQERNQAAMVRGNAEGNLQSLQCQDLMKKHPYMKF